MALPFPADRKVIDKTHVPFGIGRNSAVTVATIIVDACDNSMEAVLESNVHGAPGMHRAAEREPYIWFLLNWSAR